MVSPHLGGYTTPAGAGLGHADICPALEKRDPQDCPVCGRCAPD